MIRHHVFCPVSVALSFPPGAIRRVGEFKLCPFFASIVVGVASSLLPPLSDRLLGSGGAAAGVILDTHLQRGEGLTHGAAPSLRRAPLPMRSDFEIKASCEEGGLFVFLPISIYGTAKRLWHSSPFDFH